MEIRSKYLQYINNASQIMSSLNLKNDELDNLKSAIENTELLIPVVGAFSAGKSTLLNSFLGNNQLPTAITPETALATELRYSQNEYIEAVDSENQIHRYEISELMTIKDNAQNYRFLKLYLNNDNLKAIQPLVLVDMPGFDAPIKNHQEAILSYLNKGVYFIFLTSIEDGNITRTMQRELDNLITLKKKFSFGITKTNLRPQEVVDQVYQHIKEQLVEDYDYTQDIMLLNNDGGVNLKEILSSINPEELFKSLFLDVLKDKAISLVQTINLTIATLKETDKESKEKIKLLQESIRNLMEEKEKLADEINAKYSGQQLTDVANKVANGLLQEKEALIQLAMNNPQRYSEEVVDISKNLLIREMERKFQEINNEISQHIQLKLNNIFSAEEANFAQDLDISRVSDSAKILLEKAQNGVSAISNHLKNLADSKNGMYKSIIGS
ncbi:dynamin family protein, partial [Gallibacterium anatis]